MKDDFALAVKTGLVRKEGILSRCFLLFIVLDLVSGECYTEVVRVSPGETLLNPEVVNYLCSGEDWIEETRLVSTLRTLLVRYICFNRALLAVSWFEG